MTPNRQFGIESESLRDNCCTFFNDLYSQFNFLQSLLLTFSYFDRNQYQISASLKYFLVDFTFISGLFLGFVAKC